MFRRLRMHHCVEALWVLHRVEQVRLLSHRVVDRLGLDGGVLSLDNRVLPSPLARLLLNVLLRLLYAILHSHRQGARWVDRLVQRGLCAIPLRCLGGVQM